MVVKKVGEVTIAISEPRAAAEGKPGVSAVYRNIGEAVPPASADLLGFGAAEVLVQASIA